MSDTAQSLADELKWIADNPQRCETCGHLEIFHGSDAIEEWCIVGNCMCDGDRREEPPPVLITLPCSLTYEP